MKIMSIHWNINSSVAYMDSGKIMNAISEERFTRVKNENSFPKNAIEWVLKENGLVISDIDYWVLPTFSDFAHYQILKRYDSFKMPDYIKEQEQYWYPTLYKNEEVDYVELFKDKVRLDQYPEEYWRDLYAKGDLMNYPGDFRTEILKIYGVDKEKIRTLEHHSCHLAYAYYSSPFMYKEKVLGFTVDGIGDGINASVNIIDESGRVERIYQTDNANMGRLYRYITLLLGMKPDEHEYKVMGLSAYAKDEYSEEVKAVFDEYIFVENGEIRIRNPIPDSYFYYRDRLKQYRFDNIAGGLQRFVEDILVKWVSQNIEKLGIKKAVLSGGVGMNIKAMGEIIKRTQIEELFVPGNPSDETNCIGAAYFFNSAQSRNQHLDSLYLGFEPEIDNEVAELAAGKYTVIKNPTQDDIIKLLLDNKVVGRCIGKMEFGARALGNRSLLTRADNMDNKERINRMIKNRDFWMPFAPVILDAYSDRYLVNPKKIKSPYMTIGFDTTSEGRKALKAACHPADMTVRAQILEEQHNPELYELITKYAEVSGFGCLLNTSFNLHGFPIVATQADAYEVFEKSDLDCLWLENVLIMR